MIKIKNHSLYLLLTILIFLVILCIILKVRKNKKNLSKINYLSDQNIEEFYNKQDTLKLSSKIVDTLKNTSKGYTGEKGEKGDIGEKGTQGIVGNRGEIGTCGQIPNSKWDGYDIKIENPDKSWGKSINLRGSKGDFGDFPEFNFNDDKAVEMAESDDKVYEEEANSDKKNITNIYISDSVINRSIIGGEDEENE